MLSPACAPIGAVSIRRTSGTGQAGEHHQIDVTAIGLAPLAEFGGQGPLFMVEALGFQLLQPLVHTVEGIVNQLGGLLGCHRAPERS